MATSAAYIDLDEGAAPATPAASKVRIYAKTDGLMYQKDDAGSETGLAGGGGSVATDAIWDAAGDLAVGSGANTAARLAIGAAGGALSRINGVVAWNSGTSNPGAAAAGDRFWRTDLGMEIYYDGTRWLSAQPYTEQNVSVNAHSAATGYVSWWTPWHTTFSIWLETWYISTYVAATKTWQVDIYKQAVGTPSATLITGQSLSSDTSNQWTTRALAIGAVFDPTAHAIIGTFVTKTGSPDPMNMSGKLRYRLIVT